MRKSPVTLRLWIVTLGIGCSTSHDPSRSVSSEELHSVIDERSEHARDEADAAGRADEEAWEEIDEGELPPDCLDESDIHVRLRCDQVLITSCRELSNVVLEFTDGTRQRFGGLTGFSGSFAGTGDAEGAPIAHVWVKAGQNRGEEGPGYGERFDASEHECELPTTPSTPASTPVQPVDDLGEQESESGAEDDTVTV
jgi:hypothetical protein